MPKDPLGPAINNLPRAKSWLQYDYHLLLLRPELRPLDAAGEKAFWKTLKKTRSGLSRLSLLQGLVNSRQFELAALVCDLSAAHEMYESFRKATAAFREISSLLGPRNISKIEKAAKLLRPIADTVPDNNPYSPGNLKALLSALEGLVRRFSRLTKPGMAEYTKWATQTYPQTTDPGSDAASDLYSFFVSKCGLAANEAQVRVAKICNHYFKWGVTYREKYGGADDWKGSPAVRQRIARFSRKKSRKK